MDYKSPYFILSCLFFLYIFYKVKLENRYRWHQWDDSASDENGVRCSKLIYSDTQVEGLQVEYFYNLTIDHHLADRHIASKNKAYRKQRWSKYINK